MAQSNLNEEIFYPGFSDTEGENIFTTVTLSTTRDLEPFWGTKLTLPTAKIHNHQIIIMRDTSNFIEEFHSYLNKISEPFPILKERLKKPYFKVHFHGNWENAVIEQHMNKKHEIYFCDHEH